MEFVQLNTVTSRQNNGLFRVNLTNTGVYPDGSDISYQGDAHRFFRGKDFSGQGNDSSFVFETDINAIGPNYGPIHGGVWSILDIKGGSSAGFALMGSGHRSHIGPMYGIHGEVWDNNPNPGLCVIFNAECSDKVGVSSPNTQYIGYNLQISTTIANAIGFQIQSNPGALNNNYQSLIRNSANANIGIDLRGGSIAQAPLAFNSNNTSMTANSGYCQEAPKNTAGFLNVIIDGTSRKIALYSA